MVQRKLFKRLCRAPRNRILEYIGSPSLNKWKEIRDIPVVSGLTLWDVIDSLDIDFPGDYPSSILVARASKEVDRIHGDIEEEDVFDLLAKELEKIINYDPPPKPNPPPLGPVA